MRKTCSLLLAAALILLSGCGTTDSAPASVSVAEQPSVVSTAESTVEASVPEVQEEAPSSESSGTISLDGKEISFTGSGISVEGTVATISEAGSYEISGTLEDGQIIVDAGKNAEVLLTLNSVNLTCSSGSPLSILKADSTVITLVGDNIISDTANYSFAEGEDEPDAPLYAKSDLTLQGDGSLTVSGNYSSAIHGKDALTVLGGTYTLSSVDDGLKGKDSVTICAANLTITSGADGIQSSNDKDPGMGIVTIQEGAVISITSTGDGIKAETDLIVEGGDITIDAQEDGLQSTMDVHLNGGTTRLTTQQDAIQAGGDVVAKDGTYEILTGGGTANAPVHMEGRGFPGWFDTGNTEETSSAKGIKAGGALTISGGCFTMDCMDDGLHCGTALTISDSADLTIASGDDAIHSDETLEISGGTINATQSYEGLEAMKITVSGGDITLVSSDDGINAAGGTTADTDFGFRGPMMEGGSETLEDATYYLLITGGTLNIDASGDGLDSNGAFFMEGGTVYLSGPSMSMNGALDYTTTGQITGGSIIAAGSSGMAQNFDSSSTQCCFMVNTSTMPENTHVTVSDASGKILIEATMAKAFNNVVVSTPDLKVGENYTLTCGEETQEITLTDIITGGGFGMGGPGRGPGGGGPGGGFPGPPPGQ
ncbi:MAG: carbohydrate-binding domain-containing protein [Oscillospiraceae bacterium]|nr:carbohydrate-binding domain-containing protein [Oscillospiraceae bacterium]